MGCACKPETFEIMSLQGFLFRHQAKQSQNFNESNIPKCRYPMKTFFNFSETELFNEFVMIPKFSTHG
jgi:hypothetical protein